MPVSLWSREEHFGKLLWFLQGLVPLVAEFKQFCWLSLGVYHLIASYPNMWIAGSLPVLDSEVFSTTLIGVV